MQIMFLVLVTIGTKHIITSKQQQRASNMLIFKSNLFHSDSVAEYHELYLRLMLHNYFNLIVDSIIYIILDDNKFNKAT